MGMPNAPLMKLAVVGVSRDCFPIELTRRRMGRLVAACESRGLNVFACPVIIESEKDAGAAVAACVEAGANAAVIYLGNFGPEGPLAVFAQHFPGPVMACAAAEESTAALVEGRGDAYCGLLSACYNFGLRDVRVHLPQHPVGLPDELAGEVECFQTVARVVAGVSGLKVLAFGPRPYDFFACNAPIRPLYELGIEVMENSELDLLQLFEAVGADESDVVATRQDMERELAGGDIRLDVLAILARLEVTLKRFAEANKGSKQFVVYANKCWPAFVPYFKCMPCYVNGRLAAQGMPVACEVDLYGAVSEYMCTLASEKPVTLFDINNSVPPDMAAAIPDLKGAQQQDLFMGFHCGNTPSACMKSFSMCYRFAMDRTTENPLPEIAFKRGTLEGQVMPGPLTIYRLQSTVDNVLTSYIAQGEVLDLDPQTFGGTGVVAIPGFARFYRHVLLGKRFPHHTAAAFSHCGRALYDATKLLGVGQISTPLPAGVGYEDENPYELL